MDGIHDLGGKHGFGVVEREENEPVFHARWEAQVFAVMRASGMAGAWHNADRFRHQIERIDPVAYLANGYYGRWLAGVETGLIESGILSQEEIAARHQQLGGHKTDDLGARPGQPPNQAPPLSERRPNSVREASTSPEFAVGDSVVTSSEVKSGHTRLPAYARGKVGLVVAHHDVWVFPDTNAHGQGEQPQHLYTVQFTGETLWGSGDANMRVCIDLFEPYLRGLDVKSHT